MSIKYFNFYFIVFAVLVMAVIFALINPFLSLSLVSISTILIAFLYYKKRITYNHLTIILLALTSFPHALLVGGINVSISDVYLGFSFILLIIMTKGKIKVPKKYFTIASLYVLWSLLSSVWSIDSALAFLRSFQIIEFALIGVLVFYNIKTIDTLKNVLYTYITFATLLGLLSVTISFANGFVGPLYILGFHKNALGAIIGYSIPIIFGVLYLDKQTKKYNKYLLLALLINSIALLMTFSRGAILGSVIGVFAFLFFINRKRHLFFLLLLMGMIFILFFNFIAPDLLETFTDFGQGSSAYSRVIIYQDAVSEFFKNPLIGSGVGNYHIWLPQINFQQDDPNNIFLLHLVETGVIGITLFIILLLYIFSFALKSKRIFKGNKNFLVLNGIFVSGFLARLVHTQVDVTWVRGVSLYMFAMVGMLLSLRRIYLSDEENAN